MDEAEYTCPKCGGSAELSQGYETKVSCPKCGETAITMRFLTNGDIETVTADTGEYYELEPSARKALKELSEAKDEISKINAMSDLCDAYGATGREGKAETMSMEVLSMIRELVDKGAEGMRDRYIDQVSICAAFATARGNYKDASAVYLQSLEYLTGQDDIQVASLKVNYGYLCMMKKDLYESEKAFREALEMIDKCFEKGDFGDDPYIRATVYDSLRMVCNKNNNKEEAEKFMLLALDERRRLEKEAPVNSARLIELADSLGFAAEEEAKKGSDEKAMELLNEAIEITKKYDDCKDALAYALMNRAKYNQAKNPEPPEGFLEDMDIIIPALEAMPIQDKRTRENIAQAYMFRSMVRDPNDYDNLLKDLEGSYEALLSLAQEGDVNEMFFMSSAHSYLVLLNMKDHEKARKVREQLMEMGISQKDLDRSTRGTIGNVSSKKTKVDLLSSQQAKPIPGRRLKRQIKHKD